MSVDVYYVSASAIQGARRFCQIYLRNFKPKQLTTRKSQSKEMANFDLRNAPPSPPCDTCEKRNYCTIDCVVFKKYCKGNKK